MKYFSSVGFWCLLAVLSATAWAQPSGGAHDMPVYVDDSSNAEKQLDSARMLAQQPNRLADAASNYQDLIEHYPGKLVAVDPPNNTLYTEMARLARQDLSADPKLLDTYRTIYDPAAARLLQSIDAQNRRQVLAQIMFRYRLCPSGFEAGLQLASVFLESARPNDAQSVLDSLQGHPDMEPVKNHVQWLNLAATASLYAGRMQAYEEDIKALADLGQPAAEARDQLARLAAAVHLPAQNEPITPWGGATSVVVPDTLAVPLWKVNIREPVEAPPPDMATGRFGQPQPGQDSEGNRPSIIPVCVDDSLYVNDGMRILDLDRSSGRVNWATHGTEGATRGPVMNYQQAFRPDERSVAIEGQRLFGVIGLAVEMFYGQQPTKNSVVICLNRQDGSVIWRVDPGMIDPNFSDAYFHGTPVVSEGRVYVLARRGNVSSSSYSAYVIALDAVTGKTLWRRHLTSSGAAMNQQSIRPLGQMIVSAGKVYVADNLGSVACLDARTGLTLWLTTASGVPNALESSLIHPNPPAWQCGPPILVEAGLIVPSITPRHATVLLLDPETGAIRKTLETRDAEKPVWSRSNYLAKVGPDVLLVGDIIRLMDGKTLTQKWGLDLTSNGAAQLKGRVAITSDRIIMPMNGRLAVLDAQHGLDPKTKQLIAQPELNSNASGNVLALDRQLLICDGETIQSYMSFTDAYDWTLKQIKDHPTDPRPAMALAHLAVRTSGREKEIIEGVDMAMEALRVRAIANAAHPTATPDTAPHEVFDEILSFAGPDQVKSVSVRKDLFDRMANATTSPADEVAYHLSLGDFLVETKAIPEAVDQYQTILNTRALSEQDYWQNGIERRGNIEASDRLAELISKQGPTAYAKYDTLAAQRLAELQAANPPDPKALLELADKYPVSRSALPAIIAAAEQTAQAGNPADAISLFRSAYDPNIDPALLQKIMGRLIELSISQGHLKNAKHWLSRAIHQNVQPLRDGKPVAPAAWLAEVAQLNDTSEQLPAISLPLGQPIIITGSLLTPESQPRDEWPPDLIVTRNATSLQLRKAPSFRPIWESPLSNGVVRLLSLTDDQVLLWRDDTGELVGLSTRTGKPLWPAINAKVLLTAVNSEHAGDAVAQQPAMPAINFRDGRQVGPQRRQGYMLAFNDMVFCLVDASGKAVGIDRGTGHLKWRQTIPMDQVNQIAMDDDTLVIAGLTNVRVEGYSGAMLVLDPRTGKHRLPNLIEDDGHAIDWLGLSEEGMILTLCNNQVAGYQPDGKITWRLPIEGKVLTGLARLNENFLAAQDSDGFVLVVDAHNGQVKHRVVMTHKRDQTMAMHFADHRWYILSSGQAAACDADGQVAWRGADANDDDHFILQLVGQDHVVLVTTPLNPNQMMGGMGGVVRGGVVIRPNMPPVNNNKPFAYQITFLDRINGSVVEQDNLGPFNDQLSPDALILKNFLVLSSSSATIIVPGHDAPAAQTAAALGTSAEDSANATATFSPVIGNANDAEALRQMQIRRAREAKLRAMQEKEREQAIQQAKQQNNPPQPAQQQ